MAPIIQCQSYKYRKDFRTFGAFRFESNELVFEEKLVEKRQRRKKGNLVFEFIEVIPSQNNSPLSFSMLSFSTLNNLLL